MHRSSLVLLAEGQGEVRFGGLRLKVSKGWPWSLVTNLFTRKWPGRGVEVASGVRRLP